MNNPTDLFLVDNPVKQDEDQAETLTVKDLEILQKYHVEFINLCNKCAEELGDTQKAAKAIVYATARYGSHHVLGGGSLDKNSEQLIATKIIEAIVEGVNFCAEHAEPAPDMSR